MLFVKPFWKLKMEKTERINADVENREIVIAALVGSHNYNLATKNSDKDYKYFVTPTFDDLYEGRVFSTSKQTEMFDYSVHDIRQLGNLIWKANINFLEVLFSKELTVDPVLTPLFENRESLAMMNLPGFANSTYGTYKSKMSNLFKGTEKTKSLVERFGYDTKEACHALRCLLTLERLEKYNSFGDAIWFDESDRWWKVLIDLKSGCYTLEEFYKIVEWKEPSVEKAKLWCYSKGRDNLLRDWLDLEIKNFVGNSLCQ